MSNYEAGYKVLVRTPIIWVLAKGGSEISVFREESKFPRYMVWKIGQDRAPEETWDCETEYEVEKAIRTFLREEYATLIVELFHLALEAEKKIADPKWRRTVFKEEASNASDQKAN